MGLSTWTRVPGALLLGWRGATRPMVFDEDGRLRHLYGAGWRWGFADRSIGMTRREFLEITREAGQARPRVFVLRMLPAFGFVGYLVVSHLLGGGPVWMWVVVGAMALSLVFAVFCTFRYYGRDARALGRALHARGRCPSCGYRFERTPTESPLVRCVECGGLWHAERPPRGFGESG